MTAEAQAAARALILIVDDVVDNRLMYVEYLEYDGYRVEQASTGAEALVLAPAVMPALIVMDLSMPGIDGWETTRRLKTDARTKHIPVLVLSGHALEAVERGARVAGADAFLTKPCLPEDLSAKIAAMLAAAAG